MLGFSETALADIGETSGRKTSRGFMRVWFLNTLGFPETALADIGETSGRKTSRGFKLLPPLQSKADDDAVLKPARKNAHLLKTFPVA